MGEQGRRLAACFRAASSYCLEINALRESLNDLFSREIVKADWPYRFVSPGVALEKHDKSGWMITDIAYSLPLFRRRKGRPSANPDFYLSYQISLCGNGISMGDNEEPLVHVCFWTTPLDFDEENYMFYPLSKLGNPTIKSRRLLVWPVPNNDNRTDVEWTFSVPLLSLDSSQSLLNRIVHPAIALATEVDLQRAFGEEQSALVEYDDEVAMPAVGHQ